jgi:putative monooxygenase
VSEHEIRKVALSDVPANRKRGADIRVLLSPKTVGATSGLFGVVTLGPGEYVAEHYHPYSEEYLYVTTGRIAVRLDGVQLVELAAGEALRVPTHVRHRVTNDGEESAVVVFNLAPLAPDPALGHVDTEALPAEVGASG